MVVFAVALTVVSVAIFAAGMFAVLYAVMETMSDGQDQADS